MSTIPYGCSNTWSQVHLVPTDPNMSTYLRWVILCPYWKCVSKKKSTEVISERLDSALLNLNMVGGEMYPEELQDK